MRLLLAEDEVSLSRAITTILKKNNYEADAVFDGEAALDWLACNNYDGVILDIMMPKLDGLSVLRRLRAQGNTVPVLILTAKSEVDDKVIGLDAGANDYLTKPFAAKELLARIRAMTRIQSMQNTSEMRMGNSCLNRATFELSSPTDSFRLASKEFQMMEMMLANPSHRISTVQFMEHIWGQDSEADLHVVWVYVSYLRKKLTALNANVQIKVVRNVGYTMEEVK